MCRGSSENRHHIARAIGLRPCISFLVPVKRRLLLFLLMLILLPAAFVAGGIKESLESRNDREFAEEKFRKDVTELRRRIYGTNFFHYEGVFPEIDAQLAAFDPASRKGSIVLSYSGGMGMADRSIRLSSDGALTREMEGISESIATIAPERCKKIFLEALKSGILNYSEGVIELKKDLLAPASSSHVSDNPQTGIRLSIPDLEVENLVTIYAPDIEARDYPDIIEFQIFLRLEKEILAPVPEGYPLWE